MIKICPRLGKPCLKEKCIAMRVDPKGKPYISILLRILRPFSSKKVYGFCTLIGASIWKFEVE